jgi:Ca2+-binding RTX toxin-like protein
VALAETLTGNDRDNRLIGSNQRDSISGGGGDELIKGLILNPVVYFRA